MMMMASSSGHGHSYNSERSSIVQMIVFLILAGDQDHWTGQLLADTALLLTSDSKGQQLLVRISGYDF